MEAFFGRRQRINLLPSVPAPGLLCFFSRTQSNLFAKKRIKKQALIELKRMCCFPREYLHGKPHLC